jgi:rare lipoprotein A
MQATGGRSICTTRSAVLAGVALLMAVGFSGTTAKQSVSADGCTHASKTKPHSHWYQFGRASWYGDDFQGQPTASGEAFDMNQLTCAHRSLPLGSLVRVTNLRNHRSVVVRVNDRGPMVPTRIVDLSYAAARVLGFRGRGTARVRLELIDASPTRSEVAQLSWPKLAKH